MNINNSLGLFHQSLGGLKLSKGDVGSSAMKTTVMSPEDKAVDLSLLSEEKKEENKKKELKNKETKKQTDDEKHKTIISKEKEIERNPLKLLKLF